MNRPGALAGASLLAVLAALAPAPAGAAEAPVPPPHPNLLLVTLDTTRADHLGAWGFAGARTPNLDRLASVGTRFERCDASAPITLPSHATILTGLFPPRHGVRDNGIFALAPQLDTLAERLRAGGYDTAAVVSAVVLARRHGLDQGFARYDDDLGAGYALGTEVAERTADAATAAALGELARLRPPFFLWVHYYDPHEEYRPPTRFADLPTGSSRLYDGEIAFVDEQLGELLAAVPQRTVVAVVGDHGEQLGEHGETSHGLLLFAGARRVPLLLAGPGVPRGEVDPCLARTADLFPTLLALAGLPVPAGLDGEPLLPLAARRECAARIAYSESFLPYFAYKWYPLRALSDGRALFLQAPRPSLYRLDAPEGESRDLGASEPQLVRLWQRRLARLLAAAGEELEATVEPTDVLSEEQRRQLASLGYLGAAGGGRVSAELPDPRERVEIAKRLHAAAGEVQQGRCAEVLRELQRIVAEDPHNFPAISLAGQCLRDDGRHAEALALFERAARENPRSAVPVANVAASLLELGRVEAAERELRHALALDPAQGESATKLARLLRESGRGDEALAILGGVIAAGAFAPEVFLERGVARAEQGEIARALEDFGEAARRAPTDPVPLENAARAAFALGRAREAAVYYETLLRLTPDRGDLWKTLGAVYLEALDDGENARRAFREALRREPDPEERARLGALVAALGG